MATVIVVHDSTAELARCLTAHAVAASERDAFAIVVDSGSRDDPASVCRDHGVPLLRQPNRGLGAAFNLALRSSEVRRARYVLQLNPDVLLPPGGIDRLVARADEYARCGILAPRQVDQFGAGLWSHGPEASLGHAWRTMWDLHAPWVWNHDGYEEEGEVDWVMGAVMLLRRELLEQIGGFDERFFLCSEEVDLCRRAREAGWTVRYTPQVVVHHPISGRPFDGHRIALEEWSRILYARKWDSWPVRSASRLLLAARYARVAARQSRQGQPNREATARLRAILRFRSDLYGPERRLAGVEVPSTGTADLMARP